jgi:catechol 2,3-dioxygenase-like lactoylglutathione lyase family enzyme
MVDGIPVRGVSELVLEVLDLDQAEHFYAEVLGFPVVERWKERGAVWVMAGTNTRIGLWRPQVGRAGGRGGLHVHYALQIADADFDDAVERLRLKGYEPRPSPPVKDPRRLAAPAFADAPRTCSFD